MFDASPGRGRMLALAVCLAGVALAVPGVGVGVRWTTAGVVAWQSVLALVALAIGLVFLGWGTARLTRGWGGIVRFAVGALVLVLASVLVWTLAPGLIAAYVPPIPSGGSSPADHGLDARRVQFATADGVQLSGWYVPPPEGKTVLLRHGSGSTAEDVLEQARVLVGNGYGVLATDARGHGLSQGAAMDFGWRGTEDIDAALAFLSSQPEVDQSRIAVIGLSMGGEEAIGAAGALPEIAAVVAEGATARTDEDKTWLVDRYGWRGSVQLWLERLQYSFTDLLTAAERPEPLALSAARAAPRPILLITAGDLPDERNAAEHIKSVAGDSVSIWSVPEAGHIAGLATAPEEWEQTVVSFLEAAMPPG